MLSISAQGKRMCLNALPFQYPTKTVVNQPRCHNKHHTNIQIAQWFRMEVVVYRFPYHGYTRNDNKRPFKARRKELYLAMAIRMVIITRLGCQVQTVQSKPTCKDIDDGLQRIGKDGVGVGKKKGNKLKPHYHHAHYDGGGLVLHLQSTGRCIHNKTQKEDKGSL